MNDELMKQALRRQQQRAEKLKMPADMEQRVARRLKQRRNRRRWWLSTAAAAAVAAVLVLTLWSSKPADTTQPVAVATAPEVVETAARDTIDNKPEAAEAASPAPQQEAPTPPAKRLRAESKPHKSMPKEIAEERQLPDTLGQGIWKSEANIIRAMQLLSECEQDIERSKQATRNAIIKANFNAIPPPNAHLVVDLNGDYSVCEITTREIVL